MKRYEAWRLVGGMIAALGSVGCTSETGILVAVTGTDIDELELYVGVLDDAGDYVLDPSLSGERVKVRGRNLRADPYELLIREEQDGGDALSVRALALAYSEKDGEQQLVGYGATEPPQRFMRGEIVRRALSIGMLNDEHGVSVGTACVRAWSGEQRLSIVAADDRDCDGIKSTGDQADCDDRDPAIHSGAPEICDGKDNNCDGVYAPESFPCYARVSEACRAGTRLCGDARGKGFEGDCTPGAETLPMVYCELYESCGLQCVEALEHKKFTCTVEIKETGEACPEASHALPTPAGAQECAWELVGVEGFVVKLESPAGAGERVESCEAALRVLKAHPLPPAKGRVVIYFKSKPHLVVEAELTPKVVKECSATPLRCE